MIEQIKRKNPFLEKYFFLTLLASVYSIIAYFNLGYYHADEHFQILEFAGAKVGFSDPQHLTWEYVEKMRSGIQPLIAYFFLKTSSFIGITSPYTQLFILKLFTAILSAIIINDFVSVSDELVKKNKLLYKTLFISLWFIPLISSRFSSETWGGIICLYALSFYLKNIKNELTSNKFTYLTTGIILGLSFLFRFQMLFLICGFFLWLICVNKIKFSEILFLITGGILALIIGIIIDFWFYESLTLSFWNYFYANIIEHKAADFGVQSSDYYYLAVRDTPLVGWVIIVSFIIFSLKNYKSVYLWLIIPFVIGHNIVDHKEFRFLFPLAYFTPILITFSFSYIVNFLPTKIKILKPATIFVFTLLNLFILFIVIKKNEDANGRYKVSKYLYNNYSNKPIHIISTPYACPFNTFGAIARFYLTPNIILDPIDSFCDLSNIKFNKNEDYFLVYRKIETRLHQDCNSILNQVKKEFIMQSSPKLVEQLVTDYYYDQYSDNLLILYKIDSNQTN